MLKIGKFEVVGWEHAIRGMRNPKNSWEKSDSYPAVDCGKCGKIEREGSCDFVHEAGDGAHLVGRRVSVAVHVDVGFIEVSFDDLFQLFGGNKSHVMNPPFLFFAE